MLDISIAEQLLDLWHDTVLLLQVGKYTFRADYDSSNLANVQQGANSAVRESLGLGMRSERLFVFQR